MHSTTQQSYVGILSIGKMGAGIAKLLKAYGFNVGTSGRNRSPATIRRAEEANVEVLSSDIELVEKESVILSVVPPRHAIKTAQRVVDALHDLATRGSRPGSPLYFIDLNAVAPSTVRGIAELFTSTALPTTTMSGVEHGFNGRWVQTRIPISGPRHITELPIHGEILYAALNMRYLGSEVGAASGLKMCYTTMFKGYIAVAAQGFTTAERLGLLDALKDELQLRLPDHLRLAKSGVVVTPPKAYRWVFEMEEIDRTHTEEGGFDSGLFQGAAGVFRGIAEVSSLGEEKIGSRVRGTTMEDFAATLARDLEHRAVCRQTPREKGDNR
ncbi:6-phosphogluconate dehydrogenase [Colletotrichum phormii]|uniref:6-phosphogluconate dehydrogenase n=1 Tax=Colletotrichum phormii TaxID=359342 RepID=A0AAI9ZI79_9PEZI|nr:6-phosphogluconate dehydrogenase [Colletotrichum phormii]KAK1624055.1 6-phosphogluconate dehydrogenase [Colletotrichum phormii]